jgi:hypothetical protein
VPTYEKALRLMREGEKFREVEERTYEPLDGPEKGLFHHNFTEEEAIDLFRNFEIVEFYERDEHYIIFVVKK